MKPNTLLKRERELRGWSQARVAEEIGTTAMNVGRWERGASMPYPHFREKLCVLFGKDAVTLGLLEDDNEPAGEAPLVAGRESSNRVSLYDSAIPLPPAGNLRLVGRDTLLARLKHALCDKTRPGLVALNGLPGVGKTALALDLAYDPEVRAAFPDGILWAGLGPQPDVMELLGRWGVLLGISAADASKLGTSEAWAQAIHMALGQREMLLVIDDAWQIEEALAFQVGGARCAYLVTTRFPHLAVQLAADGAFTVPELNEQDGIALLARYADEFVQHTPETAQVLVHSVGALPLALKLIGKYLSIQLYSGQPRRLQAAVEYLRDARARLQLSETHSLTERHPSIISGTTFSLQAVIAVSEQPLDEHARAALRALSVFPAKPNCFSEEAALEVCQAPVETLDILCDTGLLESNGPSRYMLHQTISDYARAALTEPMVSERLINYYVRFAEKHRNDHDLLAAETSNILAALEAAYMTHHREELVRGVCALSNFLSARGLYSVAEKQLKRADEAARVLGNTHHLVSTLRHLAPIELAWGNIAQAEAYLLEGLELARQADNEQQICRVLTDLAHVAREKGDFPQAENCYREGLELARKLGEQEQMCHLLTGLGVLTGKRGDHGQARSYFLQALVLARHLGNRERITTLTLNTGRAEYERGNYRRSEVLYQEALDRAERFGYLLVQGAALLYLGMLTQRQGRFAQSRNSLQRALDIYRRVGNHLWTGRTLFVLGTLAAAKRDDAQAEQLFRECLEIVQHASDRETLGQLLSEWGRLEIRRANYQQAEQYLHDALQIGRELMANDIICSALYAWGELHLQCQRLDEAAHYLEEMQAAVPADQRELRAINLYGLARLASARHNCPEACQYGQASLAIFSAIGHYMAAEVANWLESSA